MVLPQRPGRQGYLLGQYLDRAPVGNPPASRFELGVRVRVVIDDLNLRRGIAQPIVTTLALGTLMRVKNNSVAATNYRWQGVIRSDNTSGWSIQEGFELAEPRRLTLSQTKAPSAAR